VRRLLVVLAIATSAFANDISYRSLQSGWMSFATPLTDRGLHGEGQIIAVLDTGVAYADFGHFGVAMARSVG